MKRLFLAVVCAALGLGQAGAFVADVNTAGYARRWNLATYDGSVHTNVVNPATHAVRFYLASDAYSTENRPYELEALRASFAEWQQASGTTLKFEDAGLVAPGVDINTTDNTNAVFWVKSESEDGHVYVNGGRDDISGALAVAFWDNYLEDKTIVECDIVFNSFVRVSGKLCGWSAEYQPSGNNFSIKGIMVHEVGHMIGLDHSPVGAACMMARAESGSPRLAGLSSDEVAGARFLYPTATSASTLGRAQGRVTLNGTNVLGAVVMAEDSLGNTVQGTLTRSNGVYELAALAPGKYTLRVTPMDPAAPLPLMWGGDISYPYYTANTDFLPADPANIQVAAGQQSTQDFAVAAGAPPWRINRIRAQTADPNLYTVQNTPATLLAGQSNLWVGVAGYGLPTSGATLTITGDGLTLGSPTYKPNIIYGQGFNVITVSISVSSNATPGMRTLVLKQGTNTLYANGFVDILPPNPDVNHDQIDDRWQAQYFGSATAANAQSGVDFDHDGLNNLSEYLAGTNPTNATSCLRMESVSSLLGTTRLSWQSVAGRSYQVYSRDALTSSSPWQSVGSAVSANATNTIWYDPTPLGARRFYRVMVYP